MCYNETKKQFLKDIRKRNIEDKIFQLGDFKDSMFDKSEYKSWRHSLTEMYFILLDDRIPNNTRVIIEYKLIDTRNRIDFMICTPDYQSIVIVELKQWSVKWKSKKIINNNLTNKIYRTYNGNVKNTLTDIDNSYEAKLLDALVKTQYYKYNLLYLINRCKLKDKYKSYTVGKNIDWCIYLHNWFSEYRPLCLEREKSDSANENIILDRIFYKGEIEKMCNFIVSKLIIKNKDLNNDILFIENSYNELFNCKNRNLSFYEYWVYKKVIGYILKKETNKLIILKTYNNLYVCEKAINRIKNKILDSLKKNDPSFKIPDNLFNTMYEYKDKELNEEILQENISILFIRNNDLENETISEKLKNICNNSEIDISFYILNNKKIYKKYIKRIDKKNIEKNTSKVFKIKV